MKLSTIWRVAISSFTLQDIPFHPHTFLQWLELCNIKNATHVMIREPHWKWEEIIGAFYLCQKFDFQIIIHNPLEYHLNMKQVHWSSQFLFNPPNLSLPYIQGLSCHNHKELKLAEQLGFNYAFLSPIFNTMSHPDAIPLGIEYLKKCTEELKIPIVALGGITDENKIQQVLDAGAIGFASIGYFCN